MQADSSGAASRRSGEHAGRLEAVIRALRASQRLSDAHPIGPETVLLEQGLALDSLSVLRFVLALEQEFACALETDEISPRNFRTVGAVAALLAAKTPGGPPRDA